MATYGHKTSANFTIAISTGNSGGIPSGDVYYFECESLDFNDKFGQKRTVIAGGNIITTKDGKYDPQVKINRARVLQKPGDASLTVTFNNINNFLCSLQDVGESPAFLWAYNRNDSLYLKLGRLNETQTDYLEGYLSDKNITHFGPVYEIKTMTWVGANN